MITVRHALEKLHRALAKHSDTPILDAQAALAALVGRSRAWVLAHPEVPLSPQQELRLRDWTERLAQGEPLPYLLGEWEFYGRSFYITPAVLIPRPETETLVEAAQEILSPRKAARVVDVGTGSGCIAITLALERPRIRVWATDIAWDALQVAHRNRIRHHVVSRVQLVQASLLTPLKGPWDLVVANLPYIPSSLLPHLSVAQWEPIQALDGGPDGMIWLRALVEQAWPRLVPEGHLLLEISPEQAPSLKAWLEHRFSPKGVRVLQDPAGQERVLWIQRD